MNTDRITLESLDSFERYLLDQVTAFVSDPDLVDQARTQLQSGGKRLRARLLFLLQQMSGQKTEDAFAWAACCEFLHNGTLIHDDIQDQDEWRRGDKSLWSRFGLNAAINIGDVFLMLPYRIASQESDPQLLSQRLKLLSTASLRLAEGQALEWRLSRQPIGASFFEAYQKTVELKTASLFVMPIHGWLIEHEVDPKLAEKQSMSFNELGILFQLVDDLIDFFGAKGRSRPFEDLREGKISAVAALYFDMRAANEDDRNHQKRFLDFLGQPRSLKSEKEVKYWSHYLLKEVVPGTSEIFARRAQHFRLSEKPLLKEPLASVAEWLLKKIETSYSEALKLEEKMNFESEVSL